MCGKRKNGQWTLDNGHCFSVLCHQSSVLLLDNVIELMELSVTKGERNEGLGKATTGKGAVAGGCAGTQDRDQRRAHQDQQDLDLRHGCPHL